MLNFDQKRAKMKLQRELKQLNQDTDLPFTVGIHQDNIFHWNIIIEGEEETIYEGGIFQASMEFPDDYPMSPPKMTFTSPMFHPNIYPDGIVCISILNNAVVNPFNE